MPSKKSPKKGNDNVSNLSAYAKIMTEKGPETRKAITTLDSLNLPLLTVGDRTLSSLIQCLSEVLGGWKDVEVAEVIKALICKITSGSTIDLPALRRWLYAHQDNAQAIIDCLAVEPPEELTIIQRLSTAGSQKLVFLANWQIAQREVVLKRFIGRETAERLIPRELQPHPLSMQHPNIIETHLLKNSKGEPFLVERRLSMVLHDKWQSHGDQEAANLLRDIASAIAFLQDKQLIHGDIKPDNIGFEDGRYILLDFGICRPQISFEEDLTQTGSLRTRAPELLLGEGHHSYASDIWALGATVFNSITGRFPLFNNGEFPPPISNPEERAKFEQILKDRITKWEEYLDFSKIREPLKEILSKALQRDPKKRINATNLVSSCENKLAAVLRTNHEGTSRFSPSEEIDQLKAYLPEAKILVLMPDNQKLALKQRLQSLRDAKGLTTKQRTDTESLMERLK